MKPSLQLKLGQHLTMTPQLQQAIRLLQLSTLELQTEIQQALEENPMLEIEEEQGPAETPTLEKTDDSGLNGDEKQLDLDNTQEIPDDLAVDSDWEDIYEIATAGISNAAQSGDDGLNDYLENRSGEVDTLQDHLLWQLRSTSISDTDYVIAVSIIDAITADGYLTESIEDIHASLVDELDIDLDEVEAVLHLVQHFDPVGAGARDLRECLLLQLEQFESDVEDLDDARLLIQNHLDLLGSHDYARLLKSTRFSEEKLHRLIRFIQTLNPRPGSAISPNNTQYVVPDVYVRKLNGQWHVELNPDTAP